MSTQVFTLRKALLTQYFEHPRMIDDILGRLEDEAALAAWRSGHSPGRPSWDMWMDWSLLLGGMPVVEVSIIGEAWVDADLS